MNHELCIYETREIDNVSVNYLLIKQHLLTKYEALLHRKGGVDRIEVES